MVPHLCNQKVKGVGAHVNNRHFHNSKSPALAEKLAQDSVFFCYDLLEVKINLKFTLTCIKFVFRLFHNIFGAS